MNNHKRWFKGIIGSGITTISLLVMFLNIGSTKVYADVSSINQNSACAQSGQALVSSAPTSTPSPTESTDCPSNSPSSSDGLVKTPQNNPTTATQTQTNNNLTSNSNSPQPIVATNTPITCSPQPTNDALPTGSSSTDTAINNCTTQNATSGQTTVATTGSSGTAISGNSDVLLNSVNEVNTKSPSTPPATTFTDNVYGNQTGNIIVNPTVVPISQTTSTASAPSTSTNSSISNNSNLVAQTGSATVTNNGSNGSATSGNADAIANVVNLINSVIASNQVFEGTINIYGNLYGDILLPQSLVDQLLNTANSTVESPASLSGNSVVDNNISLTAESGNALVANNSNNGLAISGNATTVLNLENYINSDISANNLLFVIINVTGHWYGYVLKTIPQTNAYVLGDGLLNQNITQSISSPTPVVNINTDSICNNINLAAYSGDASVYNNGSGGTAISGSAEAKANVLNFINTSFNVRGWFGFLFINIFGNWYGSLSTFDPIASQTQLLNSNNHVAFIGSNTSRSSLSGIILAYLAPASSNDLSDAGDATGAILTAARSQLPISKPNLMASQRNLPSASTHFNYWLALLSLVPLIALFIIERLVFNKSKKTKDVS